MKTNVWHRITGVAAFGVGLLIGCSETHEPAVTTVGEAALATDQVITQDLSQLSSVGVPAGPVYGVFSIGWNQFVGPAIQPAGTIGKAFAVVHVDTPQAGVRPVSIEVGAVNLSYTGGAVDLVKRTAPNGNVMYSTFDRGLRDPQALPVNVPFVGGGVYTFSVSGASTFPAGTFAVTAPSALIDITNASGDSISLSGDLVVAWTGGDAADNVVVRVVPHLAPRQLQQPMGGGTGPRGPRGGQGGGPGPMGGGMHQGPGPHQGPAPGGPAVPQKALVKEVPNSGTFTLTSAELQGLLNGTTAGEIMIHVAQVTEKIVDHHGEPYAVLLKNADRVVLKVR